MQLLARSFPTRGYSVLPICNSYAQNTCSASHAAYIQPQSHESGVLRPSACLLQLMACFSGERHKSLKAPRTTRFRTLRHRARSMMRWGSDGRWVSFRTTSSADPPFAPPSFSSSSVGLTASTNVHTHAADRSARPPQVTHQSRVDTHILILIQSTSS